MDRYIKYVKECQQKKLPDIIDNSSLAHAEVIIKSLVLFATEHKLPIRIISGSLYKDFWDPIAPLLEEYFDKVQEKAHIELLIINAYSRNLDLENNSVFQLLKEKKNKYKVVMHEGINRSIVANQAHFLLVGTEAYRKERSQNRAVATASFNDQEEGKWLLETFDFVVNYIKNPSLLAHQST